MKNSLSILAVLIMLIGGNVRAGLSEGLVGHFTFDVGSIKDGENGVTNAVAGAAAGTIDTSPAPAGSISEDPKGLINGAANVSATGAIEFVTDPSFGDFSDQSFTFAGWIQPNKVPNQSNRLIPIIGKGREKQTAPGWAVFLRSAEGEEGVQLAFAAVDQGGVGLTIYPFIAGFEVGQWYHVATVVDRSNGSVTLYLNGIQVASRPLGATASVTTDAPLVIARWGRTPVAYDGLLDDFALWSRALSASEVADIYRKGLKGVSFASAKAP